MHLSVTCWSLGVPVRENTNGLLQQCKAAKQPHPLPQTANQQRTPQAHPRTTTKLSRHRWRFAASQFEEVQVHSFQKGCRVAVPSVLSEFGATIILLSVTRGPDMNRVISRVLAVNRLDLGHVHVTVASPEGLSEWEARRVCHTETKQIERFSWLCLLCPRTKVCLSVDMQNDGKMLRNDPSKRSFTTPTPSTSLCSLPHISTLCHTQTSHLCARHSFGTTQKFPIWHMCIIIEFQGECENGAFARTTIETIH